MEPRLITTPAPMTIEEFHSLPREFGWKYEFIDGRLYLEPRYVHVKVARRTRLFKHEGHVLLRDVRPGDLDELALLDFECFLGTSEYYNWPVDMVRETAQTTVEEYFDGKRGKPLDDSRLALDPVSGRIIGAALVNQGLNPPTLDLLMVAPSSQHHGVATEMVREVMTNLNQRGESQLRSSYDVANTPSVRSHAKMGFRLQPDRYYLWARYSYLRYQLCRIGDNGKNAKDVAKMQRECARLRRNARRIIRADLLDECGKIDEDEFGRFMDMIVHCYGKQTSKKDSMSSSK